MTDEPALLRARAAHAVDAVARGGESLAHVLADAGESVGDSDRPASVAQLKALTFGTCRWYQRLERMLDAMLSRPVRPSEAQIKALLLVGLFELSFGQTPAYAAVTETVNAARRLGKAKTAGFVNAVLRRFTREREALETLADGEEVSRYSHPEWLIEEIRSCWPREWQDVLEANNAHPPFWVRVNVRKVSVEAYQLRLQAEVGVESCLCPHAPEALLLERPLGVKQLPGFAQGLVSVQDAGAQLAAGLMAPIRGARILDACAAPGGKTCHLLETSPELGELVAVDSSASRLALIDENMTRLGLEARLVHGDASEPTDWWDGRPFDRILLDVPCSATGVIRRHPDIKLLRRASDIAQLAARQSRLLERLWELLAPGGQLVYASCSVLHRENVDVVEDFISREPGASAMFKSDNLERPPWGRVSGPGLQILPGDFDMDGFYYACLVKRT